MTDGYKIRKIYVGTNQVRPVVVPRTLLDETDFANSTFSKNGYMKQKGWNNSASWTNATYDTANAIVTTNASHASGQLTFTSGAYDVIGSAKKIRIVYDYLCWLDNTNTYASGVCVFGRYVGKKRSGWENSGGLTYTPDLTTITLGTVYQGEFIGDLENDSGTLTLTNTSNPSDVVTSTATGLVAAWKVASSNCVFPSGNSDTYRICGPIRDQGTNQSSGDVHIYYQL